MKQRASVITRATCAVGTNYVKFITCWFCDLALLNNIVLGHVRTLPLNIHYPPTKKVLTCFLGLEEKFSHGLCKNALSMVSLTEIKKVWSAAILFFRHSPLLLSSS